MLPDLLNQFTSQFIPEPNSGCWLWMGDVSPAGYGVLYLRGVSMGRKQYAHRVAHELFKGPIPKNLEIDHKCRVRCCCNPDHLEAVTRRENLLRGLGGRLKARVTHCPRGHEYSTENTYIEPKGGGKHCRECDRLRGKLRRKAMGIVPRVRPTHCPRGHEYSAANTTTYIHDGYLERVCRACRREYRKRAGEVA